MAFTPRLNAPSTADKYWLRPSSGGYNQCINISGGSVLPNCVGYAYGRFMEIMGKTSCNLSTHNAGLWYGNTADGYQRGASPRLGAVVCWSRPGDAGHVAIVEQINSDGSIVTSNSAYGGRRFYQQTLSPPAYTWSNNYHFQGFIYNPATVSDTGTAMPTVATSKLSQFFQVANSHMGEHGNWVWTTLGWEGEWCCAFLMACAKTVGGLLDVIIPTTYSCTTLCQYGREHKCNSVFIDGPRNGNAVKPQVGDFILFNFNKTGKYECSHVGVVSELNGDKIMTIEGNTKTYNRYTSVIANHEYDYTNTSIVGYFRPNWSLVGASVSDLASYGLSGYGSLFTTKTTRRDATIREIAYITNDKFSTAQSGIRLSAINYTDQLNSMYSGYSDIANPANVIIDGITDTNAKAIIEYLLGKGLNAAASCGICGNIYYESSYRTDAVNKNSGASGICQWLGSRKTAMISAAGSNWMNNLTCQLDYLWYELSNGFSKVLQHLQSVTNNDSGAQDAADYFVRQFEKPGSYEKTSPPRKAKASELFSQLVVQQVSSGTVSLGNSKIPLQSGIPTASGTEIVIPSYVGQSGISDIYTNYSYFYTRWGKSTNQYKLAQIWGSMGKPSDRNIAVINGNYLIAVKPIFGKVGDMMTVVLNDGTYFNAIMADAKANENGSTGYATYGHGSNGHVNVIEWEAVGNPNSHITGSAYPRDLAGWKGKTVTRIINRGAWMK